MAHIRARAIGLVAALFIPVSALAASHAPTGASLTGRATAFVHQLAKGEFKSAAAEFTGQMKRAAPPHKLRQAWQALILRFGAFEKSRTRKTVIQDGYTTVIVAADFKTRALDIAVSFDSAERIAGLHFLPTP